MNTTLLDALDAAAILSMSTRKINSLVRSGKLPHVMLPGGEIRFVESDLLSWIESHKRPATERGAK